MPLEDREKLTPVLLDAMKVMDEEDVYLTLSFLLAWYDLIVAEGNSLFHEVKPILEKYHRSGSKVNRE